MAELAFDFEWVDPEGARGDELRATWARLRVAVGEDVVTRVLDLRTRSVRDSLYLPLYPVAEWLAMNWWRLVHEVRPPRSSGNGFDPRHCLADAGEGFALPSLSFEPMGETLRLSWQPKAFCRVPLELVAQGSAHLDRGDVETALAHLVEGVLGRLRDEGIEGTLLHEEWGAIRALDSDEVEFCRLAATLGLDPFQVDEEQAETILRVAERIPEALHDEFFAATGPTILAEEAEAVERALGQLSEDRSASLDGLRHLHDELAPWRSGDSPVTGGVNGHLPWQQGYEGARGLRASLGLGGAPLPSFEAIGEALGVGGTGLEEAIRGLEGLRTIDGVVAVDDQRRPGFGIGRRTGEARRFAFCRELFEYLVSASAAPAIVTRAATHRQQRNRAFAAELLLPSEALRERVSADLLGYEEAEEIAEEFGVSWAVVSHQLENHQIAQIRPD